MIIKMLYTYIYILYMFHTYVNPWNSSTLHTYTYIYSSECQIFNLFCRVLSSLLPLRSVGRSNFDKCLHSLITLIQKRHKIISKKRNKKMKLLYYKMESTVDSYEKKRYIYIYMCVCVCVYIYDTIALNQLLFRKMRVARFTSNL